MLDSLEILNGSITPEFKPEEYNYEVLVDENTLSLEIKYTAPKSSSVTIYGNDYLTSGENHVLIEVYESEVKTYTLTVYKEEAKVSSVISNYEKVEVDARSKFNEFITPAISITCFILIVFLFCIIFRKK